MNILVIGMGYVGTTTALVLAELGWTVTGLDTDAYKIGQLQQGLLYFYEPGLEELLKKHQQSQRVKFTTDKQWAIEHNDTIFICVGTPSSVDGSADMRFIEAVSKDIGSFMNNYKLVITKSTVPVGTQERIYSWIQEAGGTPHPYDVVSNPEFLREGKALSDALKPDRIVIGSDSERANVLMQQLYQSAQCPIVFTSPRTAELIKYASNAYLAVKISYMNELAKLCDKLGIHVQEVAGGMGLDPRIGAQFLRAGIGYGGSCFPKDVSALLLTARESQEELHILGAAEEVNQAQHLYLLHKMKDRLGALANRKIAVLGLAFKPDTDDIREAPALRMIDCLLQEGADVQVFDPAAKLPAEYGGLVVFSGSAEESLLGADAAVICTEWPMFSEMDWGLLKGKMRQSNLFDGRNMFNAKRMNDLGFYYQGVGYY